VEGMDEYGSRGWMCGRAAPLPNCPPRSKNGGLVTSPKGTARFVPSNFRVRLRESLAEVCQGWFFQLKIFRPFLNGGSYTLAGVSKGNEEGWGGRGRTADARNGGISICNYMKSIDAACNCYLNPCACLNILNYLKEK
jgi:hypothetical protein